MDKNPTMEEIEAEPLLQMFNFEHLKEPLQSLSRPFCLLAIEMTKKLPRNPERATMLRKLREAKDCAVTASIWTEPKK